MGGPWFTVQTIDADGRGAWEELSELWISNGTDHVRGRVEVRVELPE